MPKPKKIINDPANAVDEFIQGLLIQYPNRLAKLQNHHVVLKAGLASDKQVHLLSGGGSGHEPSHAGWIGSGMLSGAICGGMFASPSVASILAGIRAAKNDKGVLLVVKNVSVYFVCFIRFDVEAWNIVFGVAVDILFCTQNPFFIILILC